MNNVKDALRIKSHANSCNYCKPLLEAISILTDAMNKHSLEEFYK